MGEWANEYPAGCPPIDARSADGIRIFRFVKTFPPSDWDVKSHARRNPKKFGEDCKAWGLSVFLSLQDLTHARALSGMFRTGFEVAAGAVPSGDGVIKRTPTGTMGARHHTLWLKPAVEDEAKNWLCERPEADHD